MELLRLDLHVLRASQLTSDGQHTKLVLQCPKYFHIRNSKCQTIRSPVPVAVDHRSFCHPGACNDGLHVLQGWFYGWSSWGLPNVTVPVV